MKPHQLRRLLSNLDRRATDLMAVRTVGAARPMARYEGRPALYFKEVLKVEHIWSKVEEVLNSLHTPPYRTLVKSGHRIGKSHSAAGLINYWFDVYDPGVVITTGASWEAMCDTVWSEVRMQRLRAGLPDLFIGPAAPEMRTSHEHWAKLFSVNKAEAFQGKHRGRILFLFDEAVGIDQAMFTVAKTMFKPEPGFAWLCFFNPTDQSSPVYVEEQSGKWKVFSLSSLDHPNIVMQMDYRRRGLGELVSSQLPIPNAISISMIDDWVKDWCLPIDRKSAMATDFEWIWADGTRSWWRPQMDWEARCMGSWPTQASSSVWSDSLFTACCEIPDPSKPENLQLLAVPIHELPQIGCDVARFGDDRTAMHARWGCISLLHESRQGLRTTETAGWLQAVATELADMVTTMRKGERAGRPAAVAKEIPIKVDDDGVGAGVSDILFEQGYNVIPVRAGTVANDQMRYNNKRSELWFNTARRALNKGVTFHRLDKKAIQILKLQAVAPTYKMDSFGRRVVEQKVDTKARLGRSPDDADATNLAYFETSFDTPTVIDAPGWENRRPRPGTPDEEVRERPTTRKEKRRLFG